MINKIKPQFQNWFSKNHDGKSKAHSDLENRSRFKDAMIRGGSVLGFLSIVATVIFGKNPEEKSEKFSIPSNLNAVGDKTISLPNGSKVTEAEILGGQDKNQGQKMGKSSPKILGSQLILRNLDGKIPEGTLSKAKLLTGASNGRVKAVITENVTVRGDILLEAGTVLIGDGSSTEERLNIHFRKIVLRDGSMAETDAQAADLNDSIAGLKGSKIGNQAGRLAASIGLNFVGGMSMGMTSSDFQTGQMPVSDRMKNSLLTGASTAALEEGQHMMNDVRSKPIVIEVPKDTEFFVLFN